MNRRPLRVSAAGAASIALFTMAIGVAGQGRTVDGFFEEFSSDWVRRRPNQATQSR